MKSASPTVIVYSRQFPKPNAPYEGIYTAQIANAINEKHANVIVICPIPYLPNISFLKVKWAHYALLADIPQKSQYKTMEVYYPRYLVIPVLSRLIAPLLQAMGVYSVLRKLRQNYSITVINCHFIYPDGVAACLLGKLCKIPVVLTALGSDINVVANQLGYKSMIQWALNKAYKVTAVAKSLCQRIIDLGTDPEKVIHTPNGIEVARFNKLQPRHIIRAELGLDEQQQYLIFVGRLHPVKGLDVLLKALASLKQDNNLNFITLIIGDGEHKSALTVQCKALSLTEDVKFIGAKMPEDIPNWLRAANLLCLPSHFEGQPNVIMEAHAAGIPVVASDVGDVSELVNATNGLLVPAADSQALALALAQAMKKNWDQEQIEESIAWADWYKSADIYYQAMSFNTPSNKT